MKHGFTTVAAAVPRVKVADTEYNTKQMENCIAQAEGKGVEVLVFPELSITGYTCQDLFAQSLLREQAELGVMRLVNFTRMLNVVCIVGAPIAIDGALYNCAVVIQHGTLIGIVPKTHLPNYGEFYEKRWFASARDLRPTCVRYAGCVVEVTGEPTLFRTAEGMMFGIEICEDVWAPEPCSTRLALAGADIIFNLSASDELTGKHNYLTSLLAQQSARTIGGYVYSSCGFGESTQDVVYGGNAMIYENGRMVADSDRFSVDPQMVVSQIDVERLRSERRRNTTFAACQYKGELVVRELNATTQRGFILMRAIDPTPFIPKANDMAASCREITSIQVAGLAQRLAHTGCKRVVVGVSGGLDSTLALLIAVRAFDKIGLGREGIVGVTMPGPGTTSRTHGNATSLMEMLGISMREISIVASVEQHFKDIGHDPAKHDVTYENGQARERTQILMDLANELGALVVGTGDMSELALGWATYNGDHMSMYGVNAGVPKTLIRHLVKNIADNDVDEQTRAVLLDIIDTPISPELIPAEPDGTIKQKTEDIVGPYELHDFFIYYMLRYGFSPSKIFFLARHAFSPTEYTDDDIKHWLKVFVKRFFAQQFKRSCLPDGPKVGSVSLSPRGDWRMPSDASAALWLRECDTL